LCEEVARTRQADQDYRLAATGLREVRQRALEKFGPEFARAVEDFDFQRLANRSPEAGRRAPIVIRSRY
jgi:hypothetical protein